MASALSIYFSYLIFQISILFYRLGAFYSNLRLGAPTTSTQFVCTPFPHPLPSRPTLSRLAASLFSASALAFLRNKKLSNVQQQYRGVFFTYLYFYWTYLFFFRALQVFSYVDFDFSIIFASIRPRLGLFVHFNFFCLCNYTVRVQEFPSLMGCMYFFF